MQRFLLLQIMGFLCVASIAAQGLDNLESFSDCSNNTWEIVQANSNQSSWNCTRDFDDLVIRLRGDRSDFDIWLVSDQIDFDNISMPYISFNYKNRIVNGTLELLYSTDFSGRFNFQEVNAANWQSIQIDLYPIGDDNEISNFVRNPAISLQQLRGESVHFAFKFTNDQGAFDILLDELWINSDYYSSIESSVELGSRCADLKSELSELIDDHQVIPYSDRSFDTWDSHFSTDLRKNDAGTRLIIWDMYSDNPDGEEPYEYIAGQDQDFGEDISNEGLYYNREHSFPKSWWGGNLDTDQYTDIHFLIPVDKIVNSMRSNFPYGETDDIIMESENGSKLGISNAPEYNQRVFEPIDAYKGDVARMHLYVATRYENAAAAWKSRDSRGQAILKGEPYLFFEDWYVRTLLKWHEQDPVSQKEIDRNNAIFSIQRNRNPFIDHPEYVGFVWGGSEGTACDMITDIVEVLEEDIQIQVTPNPASDLIEISSNRLIDELKIFNNTGKLVLQTSAENRIDISELSGGIYFIQFIRRSTPILNVQKIVIL